MSLSSLKQPQFSIEKIKEFIQGNFDLSGEYKILPAEFDQNFLLDSGHEKFVVKIANQGRSFEELDFKNQVMGQLVDSSIAKLIPVIKSSKSGENIIKIVDDKGEAFPIRVLTYLHGQPMNTFGEIDDSTLLKLGQIIGQLNKELQDFSHSDMKYPFNWDLAQVEWLSKETCKIEDIERRGIVDRFLLQYRARVKPLLKHLPISVIHNDVNDDNVLLTPDSDGNLKMIGLIDFGDAIQTHTINELAILSAYAIQHSDNKIKSIQQLAAGYHAFRPLSETEIRVLFPLIIMRLCTSVVMSAIAMKEDPGNDHRQISDATGWGILKAFTKIEWIEAENAVLQACGYEERKLPNYGRETWDHEKLLKARKENLGPSLSLEYKKPLAIVRGQGQFLFDPNENAYLDCVNNISHIGHCHPKVTEAISKQASTLNTNTRYLHPNIIEFSERLAATMPDSLSVCYFVNSGSEANELALRIARNYTGREDVIVLDHAYHGNTQTLVDLSPYKSEGKGGKGMAKWAHKVVNPNPFSGKHRGYGSEIGEAYADYVGYKCEELKANGTPPAMFLVESLQGCGGQIVMPEGYLKKAFEHVRGVGGLCMTDEVQVGMGRVGENWWAFQSQDVVPDIVTIGKPLGNGHPVAAVITTKEIAQSFANGMEYFNSFGGNPVSMAVTNAVMDVIEEEGLMAHATQMGNYLKEGFLKMSEEYPEIGDVRGLGMFLGIELVEDRETRVPATKLAGQIVEKVLEDNILIMMEGPHSNVIKLKPPLQFSEVDADLLLNAVERALSVLRQ